MRKFVRWLIGARCASCTRLKKRLADERVLNEELTRDWENAWGERHTWKKKYEEQRSLCAAQSYPQGDT